LQLLLNDLLQSAWLGHAQQAASYQPHRHIAADLSSCLPDYTAEEVGGSVDLFLLAQAAGVSSAIWLIGRSASPGRIEPR
jgi:hypothetical protein